MRRIMILAVLGLGLIPAAAHAQYFQNPQLNPYNRPALSPYLDIVRGGNPAINYYLGTLPELDRRYMASQQMIMQNQLLQQQNILEQEDFITVLGQTGHPTGFQAYGGFFTFPNPPRTFFPLPSTRKR